MADQQQLIGCGALAGDMNCLSPKAVRTDMMLVSWLKSKYVRGGRWRGKVDPIWC